MIRKSYIDNQLGGQIHIAQAGQARRGASSILLIHQTPRSWDEFRELMVLLEADAHLIAMDLPAMGASSMISSTPTIEEYAQAAATVIEHFGSNPMTICGHHTGAAVAIELAASAPRFVQSLVLSSAPWLDAKIRLERSKKTPIDSSKAKRDGSHLIDYWQQRSPYYPDKIEYMSRFMMDALKASDPAAGHLAVGRYEMELAVSKVDCPVLLIEHMQDPFAVKHTPHLKAALPKAAFESIPNGQVALEVTASEFAVILKNWVLQQARLYPA